MRSKLPYVITLLFLISAVGACTVRHKPEPLPPTQFNAVNALVPAALPELSDDGEAADLLEAAQRSLEFLQKQNPRAPVHFGPHQITYAKLSQDLQDFIKHLREYGLSSTFISYVKRNFEFYRTAAPQALVTGYYEAHLYGSPKPTARFKYPLYRKPQDIYWIDLKDFSNDEQLQHLSLRARINAENRLVPFYTRQEIDFQQALANRSLEILWVDDPIELFFLHIQGSGVVSMPDGSSIRVGYADQNGHRYRSIGKLLVEQGAFSLEEASAPRIRSYLEQNPRKLKEILSYNESYVFFREVPNGPLGNISVKLTPYRSIATDYRLFPKGALVFLDTTVPIIKNTALSGERPLKRFVMNQDTGGAIRGPGRVDLFTGYGEQSELTAGYMKHPGTFYFLIKKDGGSPEKVGLFAKKIVSVHEHPLR